MAAIYKDRIKLFKFFCRVCIPCNTTIDASGHTPGLTAYEISSSKDKLVFVGDFMRIVEIQLKNPDISTPYNMDRRKPLKRVTTDKSVWTGIHIDKIGQVIEQPDKSFVMKKRH